MNKLLLMISIILLMVSTGAANTDTPPDNISLSLSLNADTTYIDGDEETTTQTRFDFEQPYISSGQPEAVIGASNPLELRYRESGTSSMLLGGEFEDEYTVIQEEGRFMVPFTRGGISSIDSRVNLLNDNFLNQVEPSFGFDLSAQRVVNVAYIFPHNVSSFDGTGEIRTLYVRNQIDPGESSPQLRIWAE